MRGTRRPAVKLSLLLPLPLASAPAQQRPLSSAVPALAPAVTSPLALEGVTVIDVRDGRSLPNQIVFIHGNRIRAIAPTGHVRLPANARVVDARGQYLIPGLWDMHLHPWGYADIFEPLLLANGVTGIRNAGSNVPLDRLIRRRREILAGTRIGPPRQVLSGRQINDFPRPCVRAAERAQTCVGDSADARHLVDSLQAAGADMLKLYGLSPAMYGVIAAEARRVGLPFGGHVEMGGMQEGQAAGWRYASDLGARIIDHLNSSGGLGAYCWERNDSVPERSASLARCRAAAARLRRNGTWLVPTALLLDLVESQRFPPASVAFMRGARRYSAYWPDSVRDGTAATHFDLAVAHTINQSLLDSAHFDTLVVASIERRRATPADTLGLLVLAQRVGLPILAGTDAMAFIPNIAPGFSLHAELAVLAAEGLTPLTALQAATLNPAKAIQGTDSLGTVAQGKLADLVLLDANPLADITNTTKIRAVVANGRYFDRAALDAVLAGVRANATRAPARQP